MWQSLNLLKLTFAAKVKLFLEKKGHLLALVTDRLVFRLTFTRTRPTWCQVKANSSWVPN